MGKEEGGRKKEVRQRIRSTDVTDVTDVRKKAEGRRRKEEGKNSYSCIRDFRVVDTGNWERGIGNWELGIGNWE
jgi:hypothetical protein